MQDNVPQKWQLPRRALLGGAASLAALPPRARASGAMAPVDPAKATVAFGHIGPISDEGWTSTHHLGLLALKAAYPQTRFLEVESIPYSADATRTFRQFVQQGANICFLSSDFGDLLYGVSNRTPNIAWLESDGHSVGTNRGYYYVQHWLPSYIAGVAAGLMSKTGKLGYVGSMPVPTVYAGANGFLMGARSVQPTATLQVVLVNAWFDPQGAAQAGTALIDNGADFLFGVMDEPAYLEVAEKRGVPAAMWSTDLQRRFGPKSYVTAVTLDWTHYYLQQAKARFDGTWAPSGTLLGLGAGVDRAPWGDYVPEHVRQQADAVRTKMLGGWSPFQGELKDGNGRVRVPAGRTMSAEELYNWDWTIEGVSGLRSS